MKDFHTIAAIATASGPAGIGVVRLSGPEAVTLAEKVFRPAGGKALSALAGYQACFGHVFDAEGDFDEAVALRFLAPRSYTGEDVVELSCHGGGEVLRRLLQALFTAGARPAGPGEFTRRAFLNGKMDLAEAEGVMALIGAKSRDAARAAYSLKRGRVSRLIGEMKEALTATAAHISAWVDFPEEDVPELSDEALKGALSAHLDALSRLLRRYEQGRAITQGVDTVIAGRPNVGKSTLMNLLAGYDRSIVTEVAGTTRDVVEETVKVGSFLLKIADTAGLRDTADPVERIGVARADDRLEGAQLVLAVFDGSRPLEEWDLRLAQRLKGRPCVAVVNKTDLMPAADLNILEKAFPRLVKLSALRGTGLEELEGAIIAALSLEDLNPDEGFLASARQKDCVVRCRDALGQALSALESGIPLDCVSIHIDEALSALMELTGETVSEAVIDQVFSTFCVGK